MKKTLFIMIGLAIALLHPGSSPAKDKTTVAVLPFAVHSAENIDYVRQGIWDMLSSRISVEDKIDVLSKSVVLGALQESTGKELSLADVYGLGQKIKADFVVWGSITKIGNSFSLDANLVDIAAYKSTVGIYSQSQGMDEIIPKINDFAQRITYHILGTVPSTFGLPPPTAEAAPSQKPEGFKEAQIIAGMRSSRKGTFTSAINPDFITGAQTPGGKTFWMSQRYAGLFKGMDIGDVNGDGLNEVVVIEEHDVSIYQMKDGIFKQLVKVPGPNHASYLGVDVIDINGNGIKEIFVSSITRDLVDSFVLEFRDGKFVETASDLRWFFRVITPSGGDPILLGQLKGIDEPFDTPIHEILWKGGQYEEGRRMRIPQGLSVYGLAMDNLGSGIDKILSLDDFDYLCIYEQTDKPLSRVKVFGGSKEFLWKSDEYFGGSNSYIELVDSGSFVSMDSDISEKTVYLNLRILAYDSNKDGKREIFMVRNSSPTGRVLRKVKVFTSSEIYNFEWDGLGLMENWKTRKISGSVSDYQFKDIDNDGQNEIVMALVLSEGVSIRSRSAIVYYEMTVQ
ncbi:MAG: VCBS repeat-containing protein [Deltaproteobacteria bacterium]|nr:VCBS repeat-containing protein [Deltaproteobacteria bacterium]